MAPTKDGSGRGADRTARPVALGAVLAGGRGSRLGGAKATAVLAGRPLISYPLAALAAAGLEAFIVAKPSTELPTSFAPGGRPPAPTAVQETTATAPGDGGRDLVEVVIEPEEPTQSPAGIAPGRDLVEVVLEPEEPTHPLAGIVAALRHSGRPVVVVGCDFPFAPPALLRALAEASESLVVPTPGGRPQPLMARWTPELLPDLEAALAREEPLRRTVGALAPYIWSDAELRRYADPSRAFLNVNDPDDLRAAERSVDW